MGKNCCRPKEDTENEVTISPTKKGKETYENINNM